MLKFYILNWRFLKKFGHVIPFILNSKFNIKVSNSAKLKLGSRLRIGDKKYPEISLNRSALVVQDLADVNFGKGIVLGGGVLILVKENAKFNIGNNTYITADTRIEVVNSIQIGADCAISWGVTIIDDNHHEISYNDIVKESVDSKVIIGDNVWVGCNVTILKDTVIGKNSVIAAGSVVKGNFPDSVLIGGNPARVVKDNVNWS